MGSICVHATTGEVVEWARNSQPASYDPAVHELIEADEPPPDGARYDASAQAWVPPPPQPDVRGFEGALKAHFANNLQALNTLMAKYPLFLWSLRDQNWLYVEQMLIGAHMAGDFTDADFSAIKAAAADKNIPVTLP